MAKGSSVGVVAFLLTDIEGSTRLWQQHPRTMRETIMRHDRMLTEGILRHGGKVLTERGEGDSFFAVFSRASDALAAARDLQIELWAEPWPPQTPIKVRMAINAGETGEDYRGMAANRSARVRQLAHGGEILISQSTYSLVRDELPEGVSLVDLGLHSLRDVEDAEHVYRARLEGVAEVAPAPSRVPAARSRVLPVAALAGAAALIVGLVAAVLLHGHQQTPPAAAAGGRPSPAAGLRYKITTVAGNGTAGYLPGTGSAADAELNHPSGLAIDKAGDLFIADTGNNLVRELLPSGALIDVVGGGNQTTASGQSGVDVVLDRPTGLAIGSDGNLYIADTGHNRVLRLDSSGHVFLVAGTGHAANGPQSGPATTTDLNAPTAAFYGQLNGVTTEGTVNSGVLIADTGSGTFRWVLDGVLGEPVWYTATSRIPPPDIGPGGLVSMWYTTDQFLYYSDPVANKVWVAKNEGGFDRAALFAGTGTAGYDGDGKSAFAATLDRPEGVTVDAAGRVFICDTGNNVVRMVDARLIINTIAGDSAAGSSGDNGPALRAELSGPSAIVVAPNGDVYIADTGNNKIRRLTPSA